MVMRVSFGLVIAAGLLVFLSIGFSDAHSASFNYDWAVAYRAEIRSGVLLPRHLTALWGGLGGYDFFFYGPLPFWVSAVLVSPLCIGCSAEFELVVATSAFWALSGCSIYLFLRRYFGKYPAAVGAVAFLFLPYHLLIDWYVRQAIGEFAAYAFLPLIAYGIDEIRLRRGGKWVLSLGVAGTLLCHLPTALLAAHVFAAVVLLVGVEKLRRADGAPIFFRDVVLWGSLGALLSSFYWFPAIAMINLVDQDLLYTTHYTAERWLFAIGLKQEAPEFALTVLWSFLVILPVTLYAAFRASGFARLWIVVPFSLLILLNLSISAFIWENWIIQRVQFPWRLMVFADFSAAVAIAWLASQAGATLRIGVVLSCLAASYPAFKATQASLYFVFVPHNVDRPMTGALEYLSPETGESLRAELGLDTETSHSRRLQVALHMADVASEVRSENRALAEVDVQNRHIRVTPLAGVEEVRLPVQYWSLWELDRRSGERDVTLLADDRTGVIKLKAPSGGFAGQELSLVLPFHWSERLGIATSALSLTLTLTWFLFYRRRMSLGHITSGTDRS